MNARRRQRKPKKRLCFEPLEARKLLAGVVVVDESFEDGNADQFGSVYSNAAQAGVVNVASSTGANQAFETLFVRDETQTLLESTFGQVDSVDVSFDFRFPDGIPAADVPRGFGSVKLSRLIAPDDGPRLHSMQNHIQFFREANGSVRYEIGWYVEQANFSDDIEIAIDPNKWINVRYFAKFNTPGERDGQWIVWLDGQKVVERNDVVWADNIDFRPERFWVGGNISFGGSDPSRPFRRQIDNVHVVVNGSPTSTETSYPTEGARVENRSGSSVLIVAGSREGDDVRLIADSSGTVELQRNGVDTVFQDIDSIELDTGGGPDRVYADSQIPLVVQSGDGDDVVWASGLQVAIDSGTGDDLIVSTAAIGVLFGGTGNDLLFAQGGSQLLVGGLGRDTLVSLATRQPHILVGGSVDLDIATAVELAPLWQELTASSVDACDRCWLLLTIKPSIDC